MEVELFEKTARSIRQRYRKAASLEAGLDVYQIALLPTVDDALLWLVPTTVRHHACCYQTTYIYFS
jgi:hypothetical protein